MNLLCFSGIAKTYKNSIGMEFVYVSSGTYMMGSPQDYGDKNEHPLRRVVIANGFYMGKYEVTQDQWEKVMGYNPGKFKGKNLPVEKVSYQDVKKFIHKLNESEKTAKYYLPSEEEWEYVCRAGTGYRYFHGDGAGLKNLGIYAWYSGNSAESTQPAGQKKPNAFGIYDMHGNVWEWCESKDLFDSIGRMKKVCRGGSWYMGAYFCRSAIRDFNYIDNKFFDLGFRLAMKVE